MSQEINVLALVKGGERYIFLFDDSNRTETLRTLGRYAADPELSFSWYDAALLSQKIRDTVPTVTPGESIQVQSSASKQSSMQLSGSRSADRPRFTLPAKDDA